MVCSFLDPSFVMPLSTASSELLAWRVILVLHEIAIVISAVRTVVVVVVVVRRTAALRSVLLLSPRITFIKLFMTNHLLFLVELTLVPIGLLHVCIATEPVLTSFISSTVLAVPNLLFAR